MPAVTTDFHAQLHDAAGRLNRVSTAFKAIGPKAERAAGAFAAFGTLLDAIAAEMNSVAGTEYAPTGTELDPPSWQAAIAAAGTINSGQPE